MKAYLETIASPIGGVKFATDENGALLSLSFLEGNYPLTIEQELEKEGFEPAENFEYTAYVRQQLEEYFGGTRQNFNVEVVLRGTDFQKAVWQKLMQIPFGETRTYGQLAKMLGDPKTVRAVGRANATNRIPLVIPCHRVIGADGSLVGFAGGTHLKQKLLNFEAKFKTPTLF
jgi:methylated-DNA-[protein]-cysteine S-methyltransferase